MGKRHVAPDPSGSSSSAAHMNNRRATDHFGQNAPLQLDRASPNLVSIEPKQPTGCFSGQIQTLVAKQRQRWNCSMI
jgi:hypothetical protein